MVAGRVSQHLRTGSRDRAGQQHDIVRAVRPRRHGSERHTVHQTGYGNPATGRSDPGVIEDIASHHLRVRRQLPEQVWKTVVDCRSVAAPRRGVEATRQAGLELRGRQRGATVAFALAAGLRVPVRRTDIALTAANQAAEITATAYRSDRVALRNGPSIVADKPPDFGRSGGIISYGPRRIRLSHGAAV